MSSEFDGRMRGLESALLRVRSEVDEVTRALVNFPEESLAVFGTIDKAFACTRNAFRELTAALTYVRSHDTNRIALSYERREQKVLLDALVGLAMLEYPDGTYCWCDRHDESVAWSETVHEPACLAARSAYDGCT